MSRRLYLILLALSPIAYVAFLAIRASGASPVAIATSVGAAVAISWVLRVTEPSTVGRDLVGAGPRTGARVGIVGLGVLAIARTGPAGRPSLDAATALGVGLAAVGTLYALARVPRNPGLLDPPAYTTRLDGMAAMLVASAVAMTFPAAAALVPSLGTVIDPLTIDYAVGAESLAALLLVALASLRFRRGRRLDLVADSRAGAAVALSLTALFSGLPAALLGFAAPDRVLPLAAGFAAGGVTLALVVPDARLVGRALRTLLVVCVVGTPIALATAGAAQAAPTKAGGVVLAASVALVLVGVLGRRVAFALRPDAARWESALLAAQEAATIPEPGAALQATLAKLREGLGPKAASPVLYRHGVELATTVDLAGYLHDERGVPPADVGLLARDEPMHTLRLEVARELEVRSPGVRGALAWMEAHDYAAATTLDDEEGEIGVLALPRSGRRAPLTLDEAVALGKLADRLAAVLALATSLEGARRRQLEAEARMRKAEEEREALVREREGDHERQLRVATRLAHTAPLVRYSAAARLAEGELMKAAAGTAPVVLLVPHGVAPDAHVAQVHVSSPVSRGPLVLADGTEPRDRSPATWEGPSSPLALAAGGTLVVFDVACLPHEVQAKLARASREPGGPRLVLTVRETVDVLVAKQALSPALADEVGDRAVPLPPLSSRADDLRALALDQLARIGFALRREPLGLADDALAVLLELPFPANDTELRAVLLRAALRAKGPAVTARDLDV